MNAETRREHLAERAATLLRQGASPDGERRSFFGPQPVSPTVVEDDAALSQETVSGSEAAGPDETRVVLVRASRAPGAPRATLAEMVARAPESAGSEPQDALRDGDSGGAGIGGSGGYGVAAGGVGEARASVSLDMAALRRAGYVDGGGKRNRVTEEFSIAAGNLLRAMRQVQRPAGGTLAGHGGLANVLMVTSAKPDEGKTFSALNLAACLARSGTARVLLIDADPKLGSLTSLLGLDGVPGLLDLAASRAVAAELAPVPSAIGDLAVVPLGARGSTQPDRAIASQLTRGVTRLARRFGGHVLVLDAPPCLATSEPAALAPLAGTIAMIVEAERTQRDDLERALDLLMPCQNILLLLNKMRGGTGTAFGEYDYYGA